MTGEDFHIVKQWDALMGVTKDEEDIIQYCTLYEQGEVLRINIKVIYGVTEQDLMDIPVFNRVQMEQIINALTFVSRTFGNGGLKLV